MCVPQKAMFDLATDTTSQQVIREFYEAGKVISAVCHGPAAFVNVVLSDGSNLVHGAEVTAFSNSEEDSVKLSEHSEFLELSTFSLSSQRFFCCLVWLLTFGLQKVPFMLETKLGEQGAKFVKAEDWGCKVVTSGKDGRLITGQNPASATSIGEAVLKAIKA